MEAHTLIKQIFGKPARFAVAAWIAAQPADAFFGLVDMQPDFAAWERDRSAVHASLHQLVQQGLLIEVSPVPGRVQYRRTDSPLWRGYAAFAEAFKELQTSAVASSAVRDAAAAPTAIALLPRRRAPTVNRSSSS